MLYARGSLFLPSKINLCLIKSSLKRANETSQWGWGGWVASLLIASSPCHAPSCGETLPPPQPKKEMGFVGLAHDTTVMVILASLLPALESRLHFSL